MLTKTLLHVHADADAGARTATARSESVYLFIWITLVTQLTADGCYGTVARTKRRLLSGAAPAHILYYHDIVPRLILNYNHTRARTAILCSKCIMICFRGIVGVHAIVLMYIRGGETFCTLAKGGVSLAR